MAPQLSAQFLLLVVLALLSTQSLVIAMDTAEGILIQENLRGKLVQESSPFVGSASFRRSLQVEGGGEPCDAVEYDCETANKVLELVNEYRKENGLEPLCLNNKLNSAAKQHTLDMQSTGVLSHKGSDGSRAQGRITGAGFAAAKGAENVAKGFSGSAQVMKAWMNSAGHKRNVLGDYTFMGVDKRGVWWTQTFGKSGAESCNPYSGAEAQSPPAEEGGDLSNGSLEGIAEAPSAW